MEFRVSMLAAALCCFAVHASAQTAITDRQADKESVRAQCVAHFGAPQQLPSAVFQALYGEAQLAQEACTCAADRVTADDRLSKAIALAQGAPMDEMQPANAVRLYAALLSCTAEAIDHQTATGAPLKITTGDTAKAALVPQAVASTPEFSPPRLRPGMCEKPSYPEFARRKGAQGITRLALFIDGRGFLQKMHIVRSSGDTLAHKLLDFQAVSTISNCRWLAAKRHGDAVDSWSFLEYVWRLE
jgi:hypothetical protein